MYSKEAKAEIHMDIFTPMFTEALFIRAKGGSKSEVHQWTNGETKCDIYISRDYHSAMKRKETLIYARTWMDFENIMLCKRRQAQRDKYSTPLTRGT